MIILFEDYPYPTDRIQALLPDGFYQLISAESCRIPFVGYTAYIQAVIILPKVFLDPKKQAFNGVTPEDLLDLPSNKALQDALRLDGRADFIFQFSVWLYQAIRQFQKRHPSSILPELSHLQTVTSAGSSDSSELEMIRGLLKFNQENQSLLTFIKRVNTSQQQQVSWNRTVNQQTPSLQNGRPVYMQPLAKNKTARYDEELIVIFLSTLDYLSSQYGFRTIVNPLYKRLTASEFKQLLTTGTRRLKQIRSRYFSDKLVHLWQLLYLYFDRVERIRSSKLHREWLLVHDFNIVFEDMIDYLLSSPTSVLPRHFKQQKDGKIIDHIYEYRDLIAPDVDTIYHIGDSKYYGTGRNIDRLSEYKQYTYAKNVIQLSIDLLNDNALPRQLRYRDDLTEGYNLTPNFFISAFVDDTLDFRTSKMTFRKSYGPNYHFPDRLFDRDTLLLQAYDINFLYVVSAYITSSLQVRERFRQETRHRFRQQLINYLHDNYDFYRVVPFERTLDSFVTKYFRLLAGKMYRPSTFTDALLLALSKKAAYDDKESLLKLLSEDATIEKWQLF